MLENGFTKVPNSVLYADDITSTEKLVYILLRSMAIGRDECFPSTDKLGKLLGITRRTISTCLKNLEDGGYINKQRRFGNTNVYTIVK